MTKNLNLFGLNGVAGGSRVDAIGAGGEEVSLFVKYKDINAAGRRGVEMNGGHVLAHMQDGGVVVGLDEANLG